MNVVNNALHISINPLQAAKDLMSFSNFVKMAVPLFLRHTFEGSAIAFYASESTGCGIPLSPFSGFRI
jgi:hypothetical protein